MAEIITKNEMTNASIRHRGSTISLKTFHESLDIFKESQLIYIGAGGFEKRAIAFLTRVKDIERKVGSSIIIEYQNNVNANEPNLRQMVELSEAISTKGRIHVISEKDKKGIQTLLRNEGAEINTRFVVDISAMSHQLIFQILHMINQISSSILICYTEAEDYYPKLEEINHLLNEKEEGEAFLKLVEYEDEKTVFGGIDDVIFIPEFRGKLFPNLPTAVVIFPTFKRARVGAILNQIEAIRKIFVLSIPIRDDLHWREHLMVVINFDLIDRETDLIEKVSTLYPEDTLGLLRNLLDSDDTTHSTGNVIIVPHGSKMQTIGVWQYCQDHPYVRIVLSRPKEFFARKYSEGYRDSFVYDLEPFLKGN